MESDKILYLSQSFFRRVYKKITHHPDYLFYKAVTIHRKYRMAKDEKR